MKWLGFYSLLGLALAACNITTQGMGTIVARPVESYGLWRLDVQDDRVFGEQKPVAKLMTFRAHQGSRRRTTVAGLMVACASGSPYAVLLFSGLVSSRATATLVYRIDHNAAKTVTVRTLSNRRLVALMDHEAVGDFLRQLGPSSTLLVRIHGWRAGLSEAEFSTSGAGAALDVALRDCWPPEPSPEEERRRLQSADGKLDEFIISASSRARGNRQAPDDPRPK